MRGLSSSSLFDLMRNKFILYISVIKGMRRNRKEKNILYEW